MSTDLESGWEAAYAAHDESSLWQDDPSPVLRDVIATLAGRGTRTVVDVGCGDGRNLSALADAGFTCLGVDIAPSALARARRRLGARGFLLESDGGALRLTPGSVDAVTCLDVLGQLPEPAELIAAVRRILVPGGLFVANAFTLDDSEYGRGEPLGGHRFAYHGTLFAFYDEAAVRALFDGWTIVQLDHVSWDDPPHGEFRPYPHTHDNWVVYAVPR